MQNTQPLTLNQRQHELLEERLRDGVVAAHVAQQSQQDLQASLTVIKQWWGKVVNNK